MRYAVSYFYQIRFFKPYMIPFSTAIYDPQWFHKSRGNSYNFVDRNGVINGLRVKYLRPSEHSEGTCHGIDECPTKNPNECLFLQEYEHQIDNSIDSLMRYLQEYVPAIQMKLGFSEEPLVVFIVHEAPTNACSERCKILSVMRKHGYDVDELKYPVSQFY